MMDNRSSKRSDFSAGEFIERLPEDLICDATGLYGIAGIARESFEFSEDEVIEFTRQCLWRLASAGAIPVISACGRDDVDWLRIDYGVTPDEWIENLIQAWLTSGNDPHPGGVWLANPEHVAVDMERFANKPVWDLPPWLQKQQNQ